MIFSESVNKNFFWDDAPRLGIQQREGQQDMAFDVLDAIKSGSHVVIEAGVGIGKSFAYLVPIFALQCQNLFSSRDRNVNHCLAGAASERCGAAEEMAAH